MGNKHSSKKKITRNSKDSLEIIQGHFVTAFDSSNQMVAQEVDNTEHGTESIEIVSNNPPTPCPAFYQMDGKDLVKELHKPHDYGNDEGNAEGNDDGNDEGNAEGNDGRKDDVNYNGNDNDDGNDSGRDVDDPLPPDKSLIQRGGNERISQRTNTSSADSSAESNASADSAYTDTTNDSAQSCSGNNVNFNCMTCRTENMEYMIDDVYKRTLQHDLRVEEILPDLHCIDDRKKEEIEKKSKESRQGAVDMLLKSIRSSNEQGKWQNFIEALERADYRFIVKLLKGEIENDKEESKNLLSLMSRQLINSIHTEECLDMLFSEELINERDKQDIESELKNHGPIAAANKMFKIVPTRSPEWDKRLPAILDKCGLSEVAKLLQFSDEFSIVTPTEQTDLRYKCSHDAEQRHHYTNRNGNRCKHETHNGDLHNNTTDSSVLSETRKCIIKLSKEIQNIEGRAQKQLSAVQKLEDTHIRDLQVVKTELKQTSSAVDQLKEKLNENDILLNEIKTALNTQWVFIETMNHHHQEQFDELKNSLLNIKYAISVLTKSIHPSPPEACHRAESMFDSGFSRGSCSIPEEFLESPIYSDLGELPYIGEECNTKF